MSWTYSYSKEDVVSSLTTASFWFGQNARGKAPKEEILPAGPPDCGVPQTLAHILVSLFATLESHIAGCGGIHL